MNRVNPLQHKYPHYTPYRYAGNKPVTFIDLDGLEEDNIQGDSIISSHRFEINSDSTNLTPDVISLVFNLNEKAKITEKGTSKIAEIIIDKKVEEGLLMDNFHKLRQSPSKTKGGNWRNLGGNSVRGLWSTSNTVPETSFTKNLKSAGKAFGEIAGPVYDLVQLLREAEKGGSPFVISPLNFITEEQFALNQQESFSFALKKGYSGILSYLQNCQTCDSLQENYIMIYTTEKELVDAFNGTLEVNSDFIHKRSFGFQKMNLSQLENLQSDLGLDEPIKYGILINNPIIDNNSDNIRINPVKGFNIPSK